MSESSRPAHLPEFLRPTDLIDADHPSIQRLAAELGRAIGNTDHRDTTFARACFEWVRDEVRHSVDFQCGPVTCRASDVLLHRTGYCYAKSHLLAALLRAGGVPVGFCYQRFSIGDSGPPFCLHGLNAVFLKDFGWFRVDARGTRPGTPPAQIASCNPPRERLVFTPAGEGERDFPDILPDPLPIVIDALTRHTRWDAVLNDLPDASLIS